MDQLRFAYSSGAKLWPVLYDLDGSLGHSTLAPRVKYFAGIIYPWTRNWSNPGLFIPRAVESWRIRFGLPVILCPYLTAGAHKARSLAEATELVKAGAESADGLYCFYVPPRNWPGPSSELYPCLQAIGDGQAQAAKERSW